MEKEKLISDLIDFLSHEPACQQAILALSPKAEIELIIAQATHLTVHPGDNQVVVKREKALAPDFVFSASPMAIEILCRQKGLSPGALAVELIKQILAKEVSVAMPVSPLMIPRKGYFNLLRVGGQELLKELQKHNLASLPKILATLKKWKKS